MHVVYKQSNEKGMATQCALLVKHLVYAKITSQSSLCFIVYSRILYHQRMNENAKWMTIATGLRIHNQSIHHDQCLDVFKGQLVGHQFNRTFERAKVTVDNFMVYVYSQPVYEQIIW